MRSFIGRRDGLRLGDSRLGSTPGPCFGGGAGLAWANLAGGNALHAWDFLVNQARWNGSGIGPVSNTPNWTFTRASTGYAQTSAGALTAFASGELRRTDKGVLIEGAGTNLCLQSQTFDNESWTKQRASVSANAAVAPDGTTTADKLVEDSSNNTHWTISNIITITADSTFTVSAYFKAGERTWVRLIGSDNTETNLFGAFFDIANGVLGTNQLAGTGAISSKSITPLANGWYRCAVTGSVGSGITSGRLQIKLGLADLTVAYAGDGTSGLYIWGAQLEATAYASSYVPTTTGSATRAADSLTVTGVTELDYPLSLFAEFERAADTVASAVALRISDAGGTNNARLSVNSSDLAQAYCEAASVAQVSTSFGGAISVGQTAKLALRYDLNDSVLAASGLLGTVDTSCSLPAAPTRVQFGYDGGSQPLVGYLRRAAIYSRALTDAELQAVTA